VGAPVKVQSIIRALWSADVSAERNARALKEPLQSVGQTLLSVLGRQSS
jgi:hypothetical protein